MMIDDGFSDPQEYMDYLESKALEDCEDYGNYDEDYGNYDFYEEG
jgi:hypothetical protein